MPYEVEVLTRVGVRRVLEVNSKLIADATGKPVAIHAIARDITAAEGSQSGQKRTLPSSITASERTRHCDRRFAAHAGRSHVDGRIHQHAFDGRIRSMAEAHALLSRGRWQGVNLAHLVRQELAPCAAALNTMVEGPDIVLAADAAQPVAFVFHELVTNAAKYGALSSPKGHVSVQWHQRANGRVPEALVLDWKETGGPLRPGFDLTRLRYQCRQRPHPLRARRRRRLGVCPEGVRCRLEIPRKWLNNADRPLS